MGIIASEEQTELLAGPAVLKLIQYLTLGVAFGVPLLLAKVVVVATSYSY